jgi:DNA-directed RNA polymerase subunit H (RpoH/RPB5)
METLTTSRVRPAKLPWLFRPVGGVYTRDAALAVLTISEGDVVRRGRKSILTGTL